MTGKYHDDLRDDGEYSLGAMGERLKKATWMLNHLRCQQTSYTMTRAEIAEMRNLETEVGELRSSIAAQVARLPPMPVTYYGYGGMA
jgi:hypothetical protein